jgi:hypothetical protein
MLNFGAKRLKLGNLKYLGTTQPILKGLHEDIVGEVVRGGADFTKRSSMISTPHEVQFG